MTVPLTQISGGHAVVECLRLQGVRHVFCVPGESYLESLDGFHDATEMSLITNRQEGGACFMAEAYAKASGKVGVCFVTRGPGATNASIGVHCAHQDSTPLVLLVGQIPRNMKGREAFQEVDYTRFFGQMTKWVREVETPEEIPETMNKAFQVATEGRPGPVVIVLPEDVLTEKAEIQITPPPPPEEPVSPSEGAVEKVLTRLIHAERPLIIAGEGVVREQAAGVLAQVSERLALPVVTSFRRLDAFPNDHPHYLGHLGLGSTPAREALAEADLVLALGTRLDDITTGHFSLPRADQSLIHVHPGTEDLGKNFDPIMALESHTLPLLEGLLKGLLEPNEISEQSNSPEIEARKAWIAGYRALQISHAQPGEVPGNQVSAEEVMVELGRSLPEDALITVDAGNASAWVHRFYTYRRENTFLGPVVGAMGYGLPAAIGAAIACPGRVVVGTCGDGAFMMTMQELATAVQFGVKVVVLVFNNAMWGTIRMHQERKHPGRVVGTDLINPDFAALARSFGAEGFTVKQKGEFAPALKKALQSPLPALIEIQTDPNRLSPDFSL